MTTIYSDDDLVRGGFVIAMENGSATEMRTMRSRIEKKRLIAEADRKSVKAPRVAERSPRDDGVTDLRNI